MRKNANEWIYKLQIQMNVDDRRRKILVEQMKLKCLIKEKRIKVEKSNETKLTKNYLKKETRTKAPKNHRITEKWKYIYKKLPPPQKKGKTVYFLGEMFLLVLLFGV